MASCVGPTILFFFFFHKEIQDFPARVQRQVFDDILDREVQRGKSMVDFLSQLRGLDLILYTLSFVRQATYRTCNNPVFWGSFCDVKSHSTGLEKYLNSTLPVGQVTLNFCLSVARLPKFSDSLIIHKPKDVSHA